MVTTSKRKAHAMRSVVGRDEAGGSGVRGAAPQPSLQSSPQSSPQSSTAAPDGALFENHLNAAPPDVVLRIAGKLDPASLGRLASAGRQMRSTLEPLVAPERGQHRFALGLQRRCRPTRRHTVESVHGMLDDIEILIPRRRPTALRALLSRNYPNLPINPRLFALSRRLGECINRLPPIDHGGVSLRLMCDLSSCELTRGLLATLNNAALRALDA